MAKETKLEISMGSVPMGTVVAFALSSDNIPDGWLPCDGSEIPAKYGKLITALGGDGNTPNLSGRTIIGTGIPNDEKQSDGKVPNFDSSNNWPINYTGGEFQHTLDISEIPAHDHDYTYMNPIGATESDFYSGSYWSPSSVAATTGSVGGGSAHTNMQPYLALNYIIYAG